MRENETPAPLAESVGPIPNRLGQFLALSLATVVCGLLAILATV